MANAPWIVSTKFHIPEPPDHFVSRARLHDFLDEGARRKLILVCAPAGSGKTTVLSEWIRQQHMDAAWVSLDEYDNAFHRFWGHVIAAINVTRKRILDKMLPALNNVQSASYQTLLFPLINELNREPHRRLTIVLDDYHLIHDAEIHRSFTYFIERMPRHVHCVVLARHEPPLPLPRLAARGQLARLTGQELNFTLQEGFDFCRLSLSRLSQSHIEQLIFRTEGWVAGMKLALLSWQDHHDDERLLHLISNRKLNIADYLFEEVYRKLPADHRQFLLYTSILRELSGPLCDAVTRQADGEKMLAYLERANLFIVAMDYTGVKFRYHHLFAEFLRLHLKQSEPAIVSILHKRAGEWLADNGSSADAVEHYLQGRHDEEAMKEIGRLFPEMVDKEWETLFRWMQQIPDSSLERVPELYFAFVFFSTAAKCDRERLEHLLCRSDQLIAAGEREWPPHTMKEYLSSLYLIRALHATDYLSDIDLTITCMQACVDNAPDGIPLQQIEINHGEMSILRAFRENYSQLPELERFFKAMIDLWHREEPYVFTGFFLVGYGELCWERDELVQGEQWTADGYRIAMHNRSGKLLAPAAITLSSIYYAQGRVPEAHEMLDETESTLEEWGFGYWAYLLQAQRIRLFILETPQVPSDLRKMIEQWVEENEHMAEEETTHSQYFAAISLVRGWMALNRLQEAAAFSNKLEQQARRMRRVGELQEILILKAVCCMRQNRTEAALSFLEEVLAIAEPSGSIRPFLDEVPEIALLLKRYVHQNKNASSFVKQLAADLTGRSRRRPDAPAPGSIDLLTAKEREVLELMATGMPNRMIADQLGVTVGTVKTHNNHIFQKLMVKDRWNAIKRARAEWGI